MEKICEYCSTEHTGEFGSGRFCNKKCASAFSTKEKRLEINKRLSQKAKGFPRTGGKDFPKGVYEKRFKGTKDSARKANETKKKRQDGLSWEKLTKKGKRDRLTNEFGKKCRVCGQGEEWMGRKLTLEWDHFDGNKKNETKGNLRLLCPNCHSQTPTFRNRKRDKDDIRLEKFVFKVNNKG